MSKHPLKQKEVNVDSLANAEYEKWYAKNVKPKQDALADKAVRDKYDATKPRYNPTFNDSTLVGPNARPAVMPKPVSKPSFKDRVKKFMKFVVRGAGYNPEGSIFPFGHLKD